MYFGNSNVSIGVKDGELPNTREVTVKFTMDSDKDAMDKLFLGLKENKCKVCGASGAFKSWRLIEMYKGTRDAFEYFECPECETLQIKTFPPDIGKYYAGNYYSFETPKMPPPLPNVPRDYRRVLDVGCGSGRWLCELVQYGYVNLDGCDPFIDGDLSYPNGVRIYKKTIHEMEGKYDIIQFNDSFEHMPDPHDVLDSVDRLLKQKHEATGNQEPYVEFNIPVHPSLTAEIYGMHSFAICAPFHFFMYSVNALQMLMERRGFYMTDCNPAQSKLHLYVSRCYQMDKDLRQTSQLYYSNQLYNDKQKMENIYDALTACARAANFADKFLIKFKRR